MAASSNRTPVAPPPAEVAVSQLPALVAAWSLHTLSLLTLFFRFAPPDRVALGARTVIVLLLFVLLLFELALSGLLNWGLEAAGGRWLRKRRLDFLKGFLFALPITLFLTSTARFVLTGSHLNSTELRFLGRGLVQVVGEATAMERAGLLTPFLVAALLGLGLGAAFYRLRPRPARGSVRQLAALALGSAGLLAGLLVGSEPSRIFATAVVPETHWLLSSRLWTGAQERLTAPTPGAPLEPYSPALPDRRANVVLVMLESVPWQRTPLAGSRPELGLTLGRLGAESVVFSRAYSVSTHSDYAQMAVLSSLYPRKYEGHDFYQALDYPRTLIWDVLAQLGYATAVFSCQNERWGNMLRFLMTPGLQLLRHSPDWPEAPHRGVGEESKVFEETVVEAWRGWLQTVGQTPFFSYLNFQANHFPYEVPASAARPLAPHAIDFPATFIGYPRDKIPVMLNRFHNALHYSDRWLGEIVASLVERGLWDRTILIVVSDHGEAFYEHGLPTHGTSLLEEQVRSLLLIRVPGEPPRVVDEPVSLLDVAPTLLALLGLPPHGNFQGRSDVLAPDYSAAGRPLHFTIQGMTREDGLLLDGWKYIVNWDRRYRLLFDLTNDPAERVNLLSARPERTAGLDAELRRLLAAQLGYYRARGWQAGHYPPALP